MKILDNAWGLAKPSKAQQVWQDYEIGMFIHWFPYLYGALAEMESDVYNKAMNPEIQKKVASTFDMSAMDTDQWCRNALDVGAKYIIFVAKHNRGFCRWQTETTEFSMKNVPYKNGKGDIVKELSESCKKYGLKLGIYICGDALTFNAGHGAITKNPADQERYSKIYRTWIEELLSRYGEISEIWFDCSLEINIADLLQKYAPNAMVFQSHHATIRWVGNEEGWAHYPAWNSIKYFDAQTGISTQKESDPKYGDVWMPMECDVPMRDSWCYDPSPNNKLRTMEELQEMYYKSVGRGTTLLINQGPHCRGYIIDEDYNRLKEFGDWIKASFGTPLAESKGTGEFVEIDLGKKQPVDHVITMEDTKFGERVREYVIEGFDGKDWIQLANGSAIGHKKIDFFPAANVSKIRFRGIVSVGEPLIRSIKAFYVGKIPEGYTNNDEGKAFTGESGKFGGL